MKNWHTQQAHAVLQETGSSAETGLSSEEAKKRFEQQGPNELEEKRGRSPWKMLLDQFTETMVLILIVAAVISAFLGKETETIAILAIVVLFAILGFIQEYRAEKAMDALKKMAVPLVQVLRDGMVREISSRELVPGDIILVEAGNIIPADARIVKEANLKVQEAALTGEAVPVEKMENALAEPELPLGDRANMLYMGTNVTYGRGTAVVTGTGMDTQLGKIAGMIQGVETRKTPLQQKLHQLGKTLALAGGAAALVILLVGVLRGEALADMFLVAISVAVAVVPEGLPAVVTITLALGSQKMLKRHALIRRLPAVETLGSVTVICSDKTGTLTENKMTVTIMEVAGSQQAFPPTDNTPHQELQLPLWIGLLCNDTIIKEDEPGQYIGDPTETALVAAAESAGIGKKQAEALMPRMQEIPFDSERMRMSTIHKVTQQKHPEGLEVFQSHQYVVLTKGAVDSLLKIAARVWTPDGVVALDESGKERIRQANQQHAQQGIRVLGLAYKGINELPGETPPEATENDLVFAGLAGMIDPPRAEAKSAIAKCRAAGIRPIMITGDHPVTASVIAASLNLTDHPETIAGDKLVAMTADELRDAVRRVSVFARVAPQDKLRIVEALQDQQQVVAMTGDGVNDSPALKKADIGVAMGITGTDVAKEASDMVLLDDNFSTIVAAVEEGRSIFDNLLRFIKFSLGGNLGKVLVMLLAPFFGMLIALRPLQLLWLNLLTDGLMGLGLGVEPAEKDVMKRVPRKNQAPILGKGQLIHVTWSGILIAAITLGVGIYYFDPALPDDPYWQTMLFATLGFTQIGHAFGLRSRGYNLFSLTSNPLLSVLTLLTIGLQLAVIYLPFLKRFFLLTPLALHDLLISFAFGFVLLIAVRLENYMSKASQTTTPADCFCTSAENKNFTGWMKDKRVDEYIGKQPSPQKEICRKLRIIIFYTFPGIKEEMKWGVPSYAEGSFYFVALKTHVNLGFSVRGLSDAQKALFQGSGKTMRVIEIHSEEEINESEIEKLLIFIDHSSDPTSL
ncbi:MAG: HAD-IC family P-type ATPase [Bacteroidales bacterium]